MHTQNRRKTTILATLGILAAWASPAWPAAAYPSKPIQIVVPYAPGGSTDFAARNLAVGLERRLGQTVVVVNRPGASGTIGVMSVARAEADGHTLLLGLNTEMVIIPQIRKVSYTLDDFEPIAMVGSTALVLIGRKNFKSNDFAGLRREIALQPGNYSFGGAVGSPAHLAGEWLKRSTSLDIRHVPYKGGAQAANDVAGGHLDLYFSGILPSKALIDAGEIKAYAVTSEKRSPVLAAVPTFKEAGLDDFVMANWSGLFAPRGTPPAVLDRLTRAVRETMQEPAFRAAMEKEGIDIPDTDAPAAFLQQEQSKFGQLIKSLNLAL
ncbi:Tripartite tricarboxylate transporter family receptor [Pigmentiphaga humi]|uniref:Tripartite tricarboxylate transporter family receptor n=1 Tax=Pigmentiphaga humi TaxID=2478468 RepID=A0A3P4AXW7_9BURK|nr:tripartite tricarboxylate transporter substrate binding protein [Pigmentiphaga humi]VCU68919.1 Tripartite tricarboxylate transporter family receptor [Pigmentiphaga humi]